MIKAAKDLQEGMCISLFFKVELDNISEVRWPILTYRTFEISVTKTGEKNLKHKTHAT